MIASSSSSIIDSVFVFCNESSELFTALIDSPLTCCCSPDESSTSAVAIFASPSSPFKMVFALSSIFDGEGSFFNGDDSSGAAKNKAD